VTRLRSAGIALVLACAAAAWYLHDPAWVGSVTSGLREWRTSEDGTRFRWTNGHAAFYVPGAAREMMLPMHIPAAAVAEDASRQTAPVKVRVSADDRWLADVEVRPGAPWTATTFPLAGHPSRRFRRIDVRVNRVSGFEMRGVQLGEPRFR
jgi:hypothetical protein